MDKTEIIILNIACDAIKCLIELQKEKPISRISRHLAISNKELNTLKKYISKEYLLSMENTFNLQENKE